MRSFLAASAVLALLASLNTTVVKGWWSELEGRPTMADYEEGFGDPPASGLYIWVDERDRVEIRVMGDQIYRLNITVNYGTMFDLRTFGLDLNDDVRRDQTRKMIEAKLAGSDVPEGFRFSMDGNKVTIRCKLEDGEQCPLEEVFLGSDGSTPSELPLVINRKD